LNKKIAAKTSEVKNSMKLSNANMERIENLKGEVDKANR